MAIALLVVAALLLFGCASQGSAPQAPPAGGDGQISGGNEQPPAPPAGNMTPGGNLQNQYPGIPGSNETEIVPGADGEVPPELPIDSGN